MFSSARNIVLAVIDFFHRPFARFIPTQTFRYLACGGSNTVLNIFLYDLAYNVVLHKHDIPVFGSMVITARVMAYVIAFCISFPAGFIMSRHIVFPESNLHGRVQFFRYALTTATFILLTYVLIKVFAVVLPAVPAAVSYTFICIITAVLSYITQRMFTFKTVETDGIEEEMVAD